MSSKTDKKKPRKSKQSRSKQAGLVFPVIKVQKLLKLRLPKRHFQKHSDVRVTAFVEYCMGQILKKGGEQVVSGKFMTPEHLNKVVSDKDSLIYNLFPTKIAGIK